MNQLQAVIGEKCPQCRKTKLFTNPPVHWKDFTKMNSQCSNCGLQFQVEPGFFIGAMYISYAFIVGIIVITAVTLYNFFGNPQAWVYIMTVILVSGLFLPFIYRYSRVLFLYWFGGVEYKEAA